MKKLFANKQVVTIVSLIICFVVLFFAYRYRVERTINAVSVPIATRKLEARTLIDNECFETKKLAQSMLTRNVITSSRELVGGENAPAKYVNYNTYIPEGSLFYTSAVTTWDQMPDSAWADIEEGNTLFSLIVDQDDTFGNSIYPGDKIDLYYSGTNDEDNKKFIGKLVTGITVLAVKDNAGNHIFKRGAEQRNARALIFSVKSVPGDNQFLFLLAANAIGGTQIIPVPRNAQYNPSEMYSANQVEESYIANFINSRTKRSITD